MTWIKRFMSRQSVSTTDDVDKRIDESPVSIAAVANANDADKRLLLFYPRKNA
jgi:hypothetical protein